MKLIDKIKKIERREHERARKAKGEVRRGIYKPDEQWMEGMLELSVEYGCCEYIGRGLLRIGKNLRPDCCETGELIMYANKLATCADSEIMSTCDPDGRGGSVSELAIKMFGKATEVYLYVLGTRNKEEVTERIVYKLQWVNKLFSKEIAENVEKIRALAKEKGIMIYS